MRSVRRELTYANVISTLCLFLILAGGVAYAADTVFSSDIVDGEVKAADIGNSQVREQEVRDDTLTGADINESTLGIVPNANALDGLDSTRLKNTNGTGTGQCLNLAGATTCASANVAGLTSGDDVYVSAWWQWDGEGVGADSMACSLKRGAVNLESTRIGQSGNEHLNVDTSTTASLISVDATAPTGAASYSLVCTEVNGAVNIFGARVVAIRMSG